MGVQKEYGYMCKIDFEHEVGYAMGGNTIYPSVEDLKQWRKCHDICGIVKVSVQFEEVISEPNLDAETKPPTPAPSSGSREKT